KNRGRRTEFHRRSSSVERNRHQYSCSRNVEKLAAIASPLRHRASLGRNLPLQLSRRETLHIDFVFTRLIGNVCQPASIRREARFADIETRLNHETLPVAIERKHPHHRFQFVVARYVSYETSVRRP